MKSKGWQNRRLMFHHVVSRDTFAISATSRDQDDDAWLALSANPSKAFSRLKPVKTVAQMKQVGYLWEKKKVKARLKSCSGPASRFILSFLFLFFQGVNIRPACGEVSV